MPETVTQGLIAAGQSTSNVPRSRPMRRAIAHAGTRDTLHLDDLREHPAQTCGRRFPRAEAEAPRLFLVEVDTC